jgi:hypothetical protein
VSGAEGSPDRYEVESDALASPVPQLVQKVSPLSAIRVRFGLSDPNPFPRIHLFRSPRRSNTDDSA